MILVLSSLGVAISAVIIASIAKVRAEIRNGKDEYEKENGCVSFRSTKSEDGSRDEVEKSK